MEEVSKILFCTFLSFLCFSCIHKKNTGQKTEILQEEIKENKLYMFFDAEIKDAYSQDVKAGARDFYFRFKRTSSNDTLFEFSYYVGGYSNLYELEYKGFLKIDSFNVAIYDEDDLIIDLYKDSIYLEKFPDENNFAGIKDENSKFILIPTTIGHLEKNKFEADNASYWARNEWYKYFE
ncbi:MAG: hypothetical protein FWC39_09690 [Bacteroidetes bacterium]|nr:hypothetical protein [Bacteroidota bacterium]